MDVKGSINAAFVFEQKLYDLINSSGLQIDTAFFVFKSVYMDFQNILKECAKTEGEMRKEQESIDIIKEEDLKNLNFNFEKSTDTTAEDIEE